ncbi:LuxR family transcriptional regulator [Onishia taeanensis]|uniref:LuxR family transcriptional regulator n=1 Tax=Onishia taeanensis TaxID=284577 RepID=A0A328XIY7_9GAMM|nr:response regulator transcription factor [Halomonas taeanensis]RAR59037.1 LuxR family transcriptional regulator [Halomonas taeanensis]
MMQHWILLSSEQVPMRWREAFPDGRAGDESTVNDAREEPYHVWVPSQWPEWEEMVARLAARGAVVCVLALQPQSGEALRALAAGARGYAHLLSPAELLRQVALVTEHQGIWMGSELLSQVVGSSFRALGGREGVKTERLGRLTERERAVAMAVAEGHSNKEVARQLDITPRTVKAHLGAIFRKLEVRDRMQLVLMLSRQTPSTPQH